MKIECITVGSFQVNTYLLTDEETGAAAIIDTGESEELVDILLSRSPKPDVQKILLTHAHVDHAGGLIYLQEKFDATTYLPKKDQVLFDTLPQQGTMFGMPELNRPCGRVDCQIVDGEVIMVGSSEVRFISAPGHTPGQGCYYTDKDIFSGDTIFAGSIGRTDFPLSDPKLMRDSLSKLMALPLHLVVHSGHGPTTTLNEELQSNPYLGFVRKQKNLPQGYHIDW